MSSNSPPSDPSETYSRLGAITREMHRSLSGLGASAPDLSASAHAQPNVQERLNHLGKITEDAANKVLNLVEAAQPACESLAQRAQTLAVALADFDTHGAEHTADTVALLEACKTFVQASTQFANEQRVVLSEIMLAQDFQDLSGQVIKKVIDIVTHTEQQMVQLLVDSAPGQHTGKAAPPLAHDKLLGPQTSDKALDQGKVDDLLASLGF